MRNYQYIGPVRVFNVSAYRAARFTDRWPPACRGLRPGGMRPAQTTRVWVEGNLIFLYRYKLDRSVALVVDTSELETPHTYQNKVRAYYGLPPIPTS